MAEQTTPNYGFSYYDQYDINWHTGMNNNFINLDSLLANIEQDVKAVGSLNFIPHTLWQQDSNADGIPELWEAVAGTYLTGKQLQTSELMGFANKLVLTLDNSSGAAVEEGIKISGIVPPNVAMAFSAYIKSANLNVKLRIKNGAADIDSAYAVHAVAERVEVAGTLDAAETGTELTVLIEIPDGTASETVEIQLPMLNVGSEAAAFCPAPGEMAQLLANDLYVFGRLKTNLDCNQRQLQQLRLQLRSSDPGSPVRGEIWFDDSSGKKRPRFYDDTNSEDISVAKQIHEWIVAGALATGTEQGGVWIAPRSLTIEKAYIYCKTTGTAGSTVIDINKNGTTIFTTQANRPNLAFDDADKKAVSGTPDVTALAEGDIVSVDIDQIAAGVADLSVILICR